jgi:hypothetical protein
MQVGFALQAAVLILAAVPQGSSSVVPHVDSGGIASWTATIDALTVQTFIEYQTELKIRLLPQPNDRLPPLGPRDIRNIKRVDMEAHFNALRNGGCTVSQVNKSIKAAKAIFTYAFDLGFVTSNVMQRFPKLQRVEGETKANRGVSTEAELQAIFESATACVDAAAETGAGSLSRYVLAALDLRQLGACEW